jgi:glycerol-3-phosphate O-acyltransferase
MEEGAYLRELEGGEKRKETFGEVLRSRGAIRKRYGKIWVTFNEPISLKAFLERTLENPASKVPYTRQNVPEYLAYELAHRINQAMTVVPTTLVAAAILSSSPKGFTPGEVLRVAKSFQETLRMEGARLSPSLQEEPQLPRALRETLDLFQREKLVQRADAQTTGGSPDDEDEFVYGIQDRSRRQLDYYKNSILHYFLPSAFVASSLLSARSTVVEIGRILEDAAFLREFFQQEFVFLPEEDSEERIRATLRGMVQRNLVWGLPGGFSVPAGRRQELLGFARLIQSYFESYYVVGSSLKHIAKRRLSQRMFLWRVRLAGYQMYQTGRIRLPESLSNVNFANAIDYLIHRKIIVREVDKTLREGTYYRLSRERRPIHWRRLKSFLRVYA